ncbi:VP3 [Chicken proventriculitis-associated circular virus 21]|nr:VP3 [Chicken proventriculitis-associated circular virus 21]
MGTMAGPSGRRGRSPPPFEGGGAGGRGIIENCFPPPNRWRWKTNQPTNQIYQPFRCGK